MSIRGPESYGLVRIADDYVDSGSHIGEADYKAFSLVDVTSQPVVPGREKLRRHCLSWLLTWRFQLATLAASLICLLTLIAVLGSFSQRPLSTWSSNFLSINALVAILSTAIRASFMASVAASLAQSKWLWFASGQGRRRGRPLRDLNVIDAASRGAFGSLRLLVRFQSPLAWFGALLTLLALGFETSSQQVVNIATTSTPTIIPSISRTENYTFANYDNLAWASAKYSGIFSQNPPKILAPCATGNCTWPTTPSLAVCGRCVDITHQLNATCAGQHCNYTTPQGPVLPGYGSSGFSATYQMQLGRLQLMNAPGPNSRFSLQYNNSEQVSAASLFPVFAVGPGTGAALGMEELATLPIQPFVSISTINVYSELSSDNEWWTFSAPEAFDCAIAFCVASYDVEISKTNETQNSVGDPLLNSTVSQSDSNTFIFDPGNVDDMKNINISDYSYDVRVPAGVFWGDDASGVNGTMAVLSAVGYLSWLNLETGQSPFFGADVAQALHQTASGPGSLPAMTLWIENFARTFSYLIETTGTKNGDHDAYFEGVMSTLEPTIDVRWHWLALPIFLVIGSAVFLSASIISTERSSVYAWKDSSLALGFIGVDPRVQRLVGGSMSSDRGPDPLISDQRVILVEEADGRWIFKLAS